MNFDFALLSIGKACPQCGCDYPNVCSSFIRIVWVLEGEGIVSFDGKAHTLTAGNLYLIPPLVTHHVHNEGPNRHYYIYFTDCSMQIYDHFQQHNYPFSITATEADKEIILYMMKVASDIALSDYNPQSYDQPSKIFQCIMAFQQRPAAVRMEINGLLHILLSHFMSKSTPNKSISDQRIQRALWTINYNLVATPSLDNLSSEACMNKNSFIRLFKKQTGFTPTDYIIRRRIMRAQVLFISGKRSVKDVANEVGYDNVSYFGRIFKRVVGISPLSFIQQNK